MRSRYSDHAIIKDVQFTLSTEISQDENFEAYLGFYLNCYETQKLFLYVSLI